MDTAATGRARLTVIPAIIALAFNVIVPVAAVAVPDAAPEALRPRPVAAAEGPDLRIETKPVDAAGDPAMAPLLAGDTASFEIVVRNEGLGDAIDIMLIDDLPAGVEWDFEIVEGDGECAAASSQEEGEQPRMSITCELMALGSGESMTILAWGQTASDDCGELLNVVRVDAANNDPVEPAMAAIEVLCPEPASLTIAVSADTTRIELGDGSGDLGAVPGTVTWTVSYTVVNGPVTNAIITDTVPVGLVYVEGSAAGAVYDASARTLTWAYPSLTTSGSVTFQTAIDPETISRTSPTTNVAAITSDQTARAEGSGSLDVTVEQQLGGNPTPAPAPRGGQAPASGGASTGELPDTAVAPDPDGSPIRTPIALLVLAVVGATGLLGAANLRAASAPTR